MSNAVKRIPGSNLILMNPQAQLYHKALEATNKDLVLVVAERCPEGALMTQEAYAKYQGLMTLADMATHSVAYWDAAIAASFNMEVITADDVGFSSDGA